MRGWRCGCRPCWLDGMERRCVWPRSPTSATCSGSSSPSVERPYPTSTRRRTACLGDLARQLGLALHNVRLDTTLQASLDELQVRNTQLRSVTGRAHRRRRQMRAVAGSSATCMTGRSSTSWRWPSSWGWLASCSTPMRRRRRPCWKSSARTPRWRWTELRELAHGIYPPLLRPTACRRRCRRPPTGRCCRRASRLGASALRPGCRGRGLLLLPRGDPERGETPGPTPISRCASGTPTGC